MNEAFNFRASALCYVNFQRRSLASLEPQDVLPQVTADGSKIFRDSDGEIVFASYASGAVVCFRANAVTARTASGDYWMVGPRGNSFRVD